MVSHDRYFINKLANKILYLTQNGIIEYEGNYDDYLEGKQEIVTEQKQTGKAEEKGHDYKEKKRLEAEKRKILNRNNKVENLIETTEKKIAELEREYNIPEIASDYEKLSEISTQIETLRNELDRLMKEWEELQFEIGKNMK